METTVALLCILAAVVSVAIYTVRRGMNYWKTRGIPHDEPAFLYGNIKGVRHTRHMKDVILDLYTKYKGSGPFCGFYLFMKPVVLVLDLQLIKKILVKDFSNFVERGVYYNEIDDPMSAHLFNLHGTKWSTLRNKLTPTFSSGKMKFMFSTVATIGHEFVKAFDELIGADDNGSVVEIKDINARFTTDVIATCAFGIECNTLKDPQAEFREYGRRIFSESRHHWVVTNLMQSCPNVARKLRMQVIPRDIQRFVMGVVRDTVAFREKNQIKRNDFMDVLIGLKNAKPTETESGEVHKGLTLEEISAQAFVFYAAGFETSSSTLSFAIYQLALNPHLQDKLRTEVNDVLARHNGELTYESITEMRYMGQVIDETLRMYSILPTLQRVAKEDYDTGDPKYKIEKGTTVFIPAGAIHFDPEIYPNPTQFDPDRFAPAERSKRESVTWLAFGEGPKNCIGLRFGVMQTKIGLTLLMKNFKFSTCPQTQIPLKFDNKQPQQFLATADGIYLRAQRVVVGSSTK